MYVPYDEYKKSLEAPIFKYLGECGFTVHQGFRSFLSFEDSNLFVEEVIPMSDQMERVVIGPEEGFADYVWEPKILTGIRFQQHRGTSFQLNCYDSGNMVSNVCQINLNFYTAKKMKEEFGR